MDIGPITYFEKKKILVFVSFLLTPPPYASPAAPPPFAS